ncbi:MAG: SDR family oxidoreductase [Deltaproteobacteria bacterium]|nr:SDR family oxidoreductase [Deltaproteobacteria bacterium]MBW1950589.1 SDR family oxidoreductase [Deltaproteobacteria bacterium]MBW2347004.1 SDR family oxidoreductase [Deltaproteobacteria bacterium]
MRLKNKVALLTAAAGAGIGQATAMAMAREGASIVLTDAHPKRPFSVAEKIQEETGAECLGMQCDVNDLGQVKAAVRAAEERFGRVDILFNNAGINRLARVEEMTDEVWELVINTCLRGTFYTCRAVLPGMIERRFGRIVNVASIAGHLGLADGQAHYAAAKAGIMALTRCIAAENAPHGITANTIAPGFIYNEFLARIYPEKEISRMLESIPYVRKGTPQDIANIAVFLSSDEGEYLTGQTLCATGGSFMH